MSRDMDVTNGMQKSWDHPWSTDEMRNKRTDWSLAGDVGLLKHLQQFSENLTTKANKTQEVINSLTSQFNETAIFIDNITNTSLALANTQFIESRVQEDDVETEKTKKIPQQVEDIAPEDLLVRMSESVKQGLRIMDEKCRKMEVVDSDSEEEGGAKVLSVILEPNDPYQDRPLPYVIGSDKWKASNKIGLESSSSESEQLEEDEDESDNERNSKVISHILKENSHRTVTTARRSSSSSSESDNVSRHSSNATFPNDGNFDGISRNKIDTDSESSTPVKEVSKTNPAPNFAEELAKRLGNVCQKPIAAGETSEPSINRLKDDLFVTEDKEDIFSRKSDNLFDEDKGLFDNNISANFWQETTRKSFKANVIPASIDVPPPISTVSTKPKSAIDDLFGDADSDDSDDIFSSKNYAKKTVKETRESGGTESLRKKHLDTLIATPTSVATSTPTNINADNLFNDNEDEGDLFGSYGKKLPKSVETSPSAASSHSTQESNKKKPAGAVSIFGTTLASDIENKFSRRMLQRQSSGSSSDATDRNETTRTSESIRDSTMRNPLSNSNTGDQSLIVGNLLGANVQNSTANVESGDSSGISIRPPSINNTAGSGPGADFQPEMTSSRLKSEEIYRERVQSDSLFVSQNRERINSTSNSANTTENRNGDDVFDSEDLFGPPPLPSGELKQAKSKVQSLFDDSDSGDELFSTTSSGSRSQRSTDFLSTGSVFQDKSKGSQQRPRFDENVDLFGSKDSVDVDIFGIVGNKSRSVRDEGQIATRKPLDNLPGDLFGNPKPKAAQDVDNFDTSIKVKGPQLESKTETQKIADDSPVDLFGSPIDRHQSTEDDIFSSNSKSKTSQAKGKSVDEHSEESRKDDPLIAKKSQSITSVTKKTSLFDDDDDEDDHDDDLFGVKTAKNRYDRTFEPSLETENENDLFATSRKPNVGMVESEVWKDQSSIEPGMSNNGAIDPVIKPEMKDNDIFSEDKSSVIVSNTLGNDIFDDDTYNDLFSKPPAITEKESDKKVENQEKFLQDNEVMRESSKVDVRGTVKSQEEVDGKLEEKVTPKPKETATDSNLNDEEGKKEPPKTLDIRTNVSPAEESTQALRRSVSGKIKDLMGKMGDLKILSPTDTPPLWRRSEERPDEEEDGTQDRENVDGGCMSVQGRSSPPSVSEGSVVGTQSPRSAVSSEGITESAISFEQPAQVETLSAASKNRVRIQAKRRPQSRHARKSALRNSGLDFDTVDGKLNVKGADDESSRIDSGTGQVDVPSGLFVTVTEDHQNTDANLFAATDEKSEIGSVSKESSMSANRNTLLSPSTDEEDLFDVPPDLPEDTLKEDALFGRAPLLSPVERIPVAAKPLRETFVGRIEDPEDDSSWTGAEGKQKDVKAKSSDPSFKEDNAGNTSGKVVGTDNEDNDVFAHRTDNEPLDPLRDTSHDPLKDPSQLFAFVTKTPSPEKGKTLLFSEDDSLFSAGSKKPSTKHSEPVKKPVLDLFEDDGDGELFVVPPSKSVKKPLKDTRTGLFDDEGSDEDAQGLFSLTSSNLAKSEKSKKGTKLFEAVDDDDADDADLFTEKSERTSKASSWKGSDIIFKDEPPLITSKQPTRAPNLEDIFGDNSSEEDDLFASGKPPPKRLVSPKSVFPSDGDDEDPIFGKSSSSKKPDPRPDGSRVVMQKKPIMRDLKKTAEKIVEDPLSLAQDY